MTGGSRAPRPLTASPRPTRASATPTAPDQAAIAALAAAIGARFRPERVVLFGSRAHGTPRPDSDIDLMVVLAGDEREADVAERITRSVDPPPTGRLHITVRSPEQVRVGLAEGDFFIVDAVARGITLYVAAGGDAAMTEGGNDAAAARPQSVLKRATRDWLHKGEMDDQATRALRNLDPPIFDGVCFHAQQSAEKHLKALLQEHEVRFPRTHDLIALIGLARPFVPGIVAHAVDLAWLSDYGGLVRYPGTTAGVAEADRALAVAAAVRALVRPALGLAATDA